MHHGRILWRYWECGRSIVPGRRSTGQNVGGLSTRRSSGRWGDCSDWKRLPYEGHVVLGLPYAVVAPSAWEGCSHIFGVATTFVLHLLLSAYACEVSQVRECWMRYVWWRY